MQHQQLLDWGVRSGYQEAKSHSEILVAKRLRPLLQIWIPDVVVARAGIKRYRGVQDLLKKARQEVGLTSFLVTRGPHNHCSNQNKYERAKHLAARFPEIGWQLPPKRKPWESEHYVMSIFDALSVAVALLRVEICQARVIRIYQSGFLFPVRCMVIFESGSTRDSGAILGKLSALAPHGAALEMPTGSIVWRAF